VAEHRGISSSEGKPEIRVACPPEFGGQAGHWTPEHLLVLSVEVCVMTTFLSLFEMRGGVLVSYESQTVGKASLRNWAFRFTDICVMPKIVVEDEAYISLAREAIERAADECLVSRTLNIRPMVQPTVECVT
jgi:organic hydroperoxide reductase OsmC/OhrA